MFKEKCKRCNRKIQKDFDFCPYCGSNVGKERNQRDFGFLGKDDFIASDNFNLQGMDNIISSLMNQIESQLIGKKMPGKRISISISSPKIKEPKNNLSEDKAREMPKLPRKEAKADVRRISDKVIYEIEVPGVINLNDILINKLENSIEIKAISNEAVYVKILPLKLPLINYRLEQEKLILEFKSK